MKKIILFAAALAAFVACNKEQQQSCPFEKGQKVTLNIDASSSTKVTSADDGTGISFTWEEGDEIKVTVGGSSAKFTLKTGAGESSATFEGEMPAGGSTFDVQYPYETPALGSQTYSSTEPIPHDMMLLKATGCSLSNPSFSLTAQNAVLQVNLYGWTVSWTNIYLTKVEVVDESSNTYALNISPAVKIGGNAGAATPFYIVVPVGNYKFHVEAFDNSPTPQSVGRLVPESAKNFVANQVLNMEAAGFKTKHSVWVSTNGEGNGTYNVSPTAAYEGEIISITATPSAGSTFAGWTSSDVTIADPDAASTTFTMPNKNANLTVYFHLEKK